MRYLTILVLLASCLGYSQNHEIGVFVGGSNVISDVGRASYFAPNQRAFGLVYRWNRSPRHSYRFSMIFSDLEANDSRSKDPRRIARNYTSVNNVVELSAGMEFTFLEFDLHAEKLATTPYIFAGISALSYQNIYFLDDALMRDDNRSLTLAIPVGLGLKTRISKRLVLSAEVAARFSYTDGLDGSNPNIIGTVEHQRFGNINNTDWYVFSGVMLTYTFGKRPCHCRNGS